MQLKENVNFNKLIKLPGHVTTADEQSAQCVIFWVNVQTIQRILTGFQLLLTINKQDQNLRLSKLISGGKDTKVYVKKELVIHNQIRIKMRNVEEGKNK